MTDQIIMKVCKLALDGDIKACRLFLEISSKMNNPSTAKQKYQTNYIQINNTIINEEIVNSLNEKQLLQIERIITGKEKRKIIEVISPKKMN